jgi:hypothetical protein
MDPWVKNPSARDAKADYRQNPGTDKRANGRHSWISAGLPAISTCRRDAVDLDRLPVFELESPPAMLLPDGTPL